MNILELLRRIQAPAVDTETGYYNTYQPKIKQVITETDDDQPNKRVTTIDYPKVDTRELGSLSMGPLSMMAAERRGYDPMLMQSEEKIPMDQLYTDTIGNTGLTRNQIINQGLQNVADAGLMEGAKYGPGAMIGSVGRAAELGRRTAITTPLAIGAVSTLPLIPIESDKNLPDPYRVETYNAPVKPVVGNNVTLSDRESTLAPLPPGFNVDVEGALLSAQNNANNANMQGRSGYFTERPTERIDFLRSQNAPQITSARPEAIQMEQNPILKSMYGKFARDPQARKQQYLDQLNKIFKNSMMLNAIAQLTGGQSQANAYLRMATSKMDAIDKFDQEQRLQDIWKNIYFDQNGEYRAPGNWDKAFEMATVLGASPQEASEIASIAYKKPDRDEEKKSAYEKLLDNAVASGLINEAEKTTAMRNKLGLTEDAQALTALEKNIKSALESGAITKEQANEARKFALLGGKPGSDNEYAARSAMMRLYQARYTTQFGLKPNAPSFEKFLRDNMADYNALLYGIAAGAISPTSSNSGMVTGVTRVN